MNSYYSSANSSLVLTPIVKKILIATIGFWFLGQIICEAILRIPLAEWLALQPNLVLDKFFLWQPFSYLFLHSVGQWSHLLFNMLMLWMLGSFLEQQWGSRFFILYYFASGIGAAWFHILALSTYSYFAEDALVGQLSTPVIGSSGAIFGLILAYGWLFGNRIIYFMLIFPMKARYFAMILGAIQIVSLLSVNTNNVGVGSNNVAYLVHLGGLVSGFLFLFFYVFFKNRFKSFPFAYKWRQGFSKKRRNLRLVVTNDKKKNDSRYYH